MKYIFIFILGVYSNQSSALAIWPDTTAPCNSTLQACVDGSVTGEVIEIRTNTPIDESISSTQAISLIAGVGYKPVFAAGRSIEMSGTANTDLTITYSGLTFLRGRIAYRAQGFSSTTTTLNILNNHVMDNSLSFESIRLLNFNDHTLNLNIDHNQVVYNATVTGLDRNGAIAITNGSPGGTSTSGTISGRIYNNQITVYGDESVGIGFYEFTGSSSDLDVSSNTLIGGERAAVYIEKGPQSLGSSRFDFAHNAIYNNPVDVITNGFQTNVSDGSIEVNAVNNTVLGADVGFNFQPSFGGVLDLNFYNNLVTQTRSPFIIRNPNNADGNVNVTFDNDNNLFYANDVLDPDFVAGPEFSSADPMVKSVTDARLKPGSPAIETANSLYLFFVGTAPLIDADGLFRLKNGNLGTGGIALDIGAYEAGDIRILDIKKNSSNNLNPIESTPVNSQEFAKLQISHNFNPDGTSSSDGIRNDNNIGVYRAGAIWEIFTQDFSTIDINTAFNVWSPAPSGQNFIHTAEDAISASESFTELDRSGLNNNPNAILSVTQFWDGLYNDNPIGVFYNPFTGRWNIYNSNFEDMPLMAQFNVYYQTASANAFIHRTSDANTSVDATLIDHPLLNNSPCAQFQITYDSGIMYPYRTGVYYDQTNEQWGIFNQGGEAMPESARFHVIISAEQIAACKDIIFIDDFE